MLFITLHRTFKPLLLPSQPRIDLLHSKSHPIDHRISFICRIMTFAVTTRKAVLPGPKKVLICIFGSYRFDTILLRAMDVRCGHTTHWLLFSLCSTAFCPCFLFVKPFLFNQLSKLFRLSWYCSSASRCFPRLLLGF